MSEWYQPLLSWTLSLVTVRLPTRALGGSQVMKEILGSDKEWMASLKGRR